MCDSSGQATSNCGGLALEGFCCPSVGAQVGAQCSLSTGKGPALHFELLDLEYFSVPIQTFATPSPLASIFNPCRKPLVLHPWPLSIPSASDQHSVYQPADPWLVPGWTSASGRL